MNTAHTWARGVSPSLQFFLFFWAYQFWIYALKKWPLVSTWIWVTLQVLSSSFRSRYQGNLLLCSLCQPKLTLRWVGLDQCLWGPNIFGPQKEKGKKVHGFMLLLVKNYVHYTTACSFLIILFYMTWMDC